MKSLERAVNSVNKRIRDNDARWQMLISGFDKNGRPLDREERHLLEREIKRENAFMEGDFANAQRFTTIVNKKSKGIMTEQMKELQIAKDIAREKMNESMVKTAQIIEDIKTTGFNQRQFKDNTKKKIEATKEIEKIKTRGHKARQFEDNTEKKIKATKEIEAEKTAGAKIRKSMTDDTSIKIQQAQTELIKGQKGLTESKRKLVTFTQNALRKGQISSQESAQIISNIKTGTAQDVVNIYSQLGTRINQMDEIKHKRAMELQAEKQKTIGMVINPEEYKKFPRYASIMASNDTKMKQKAQEYAVKRQVHWQSMGYDAKYADFKAKEDTEKYLTEKKHLSKIDTIKEKIMNAWDKPTFKNQDRKITELKLW